jgi:hypothetical protein
MCRKTPEYNEPDIHLKQPYSLHFEHFFFIFGTTFLLNLTRILLPIGELQCLHLCSSFQAIFDTSYYQKTPPGGGFFYFDKVRKLKDPPPVSEKKKADKIKADLWFHLGK